MGEFVLKYWLQFAFGIITGALTLLWAMLKKHISNQRAIQRGVQALLRDRLTQSYHYHMSQEKCISIHDRENLSNLYNQYHSLGANGIIDDLMNKLKKLPVTREG